MWAVLWGDVGICGDMWGDVRRAHLFQADDDRDIGSVSCGGGLGEVGRHRCLPTLGERLCQPRTQRMAYALVDLRAQVEREM